MGLSQYTVETWQTIRGWSARVNFLGIETEGGASEHEAINAVVGASLIALGHRVSPPRLVEFSVKRLSDDLIPPT